MKDSAAVMMAVGAGVMFALVLSIPIFVTGQSAPLLRGEPTRNVQSQTVTLAEATQMMKDVPSYASLIQSNNSITFASMNVRLVVLAIDHEGALNLTGRQPPGYATDDAFVIHGLIDPTLVIPRGAVVQVTAVNLDKDMYHNFAVIAVAPPYSYNVMQGMMVNWQQRQGFVQMMTPLLPPASYAQGAAYEYVYTTTLDAQTRLWYLCTYLGHAQAGMYGEVLVN